MTFEKLSRLCEQIRIFAISNRCDAQIRMNILTYFDIKEKGKNLFHYEGKDEYFFNDTLVVIDSAIETGKLFIERRQ